MRQCDLQQFRMPCQRPGYKSAANARIACFSKFALQPPGVAISTANQAETTGCGDGRGKAAASGKCHRRRDDRVLDAEHFG